MRLLPVLAIVAVSASGPARADVVTPPPDDCLDGSRGVECLGPPTCVPRTCSAGSDCLAGEACVPRNLCIEAHECGGMAGGVPEDHVLTFCTDTRVCPGAAECQTLSVCVPAAGVDAGPTGGGDDGGCSAGGDRPVVPVAVLLALVPILLRRRRR